MPGTSPTVPRWVVAVATLGVFALVGPLWPWLMDALGFARGPYAGTLDRLLRVYSWYWGPAVLLGAVLFGPARAFSALGLAANPVRALGVAALGTLPMFAGYAVQGTFTPGALASEPLCRYALLPGVMEEILFRGMLFGFLFHFARWGFVPAAAVGAAAFGAGHLWQGNTPGEVLGVFAITALGAAWFAWLYVEWRMNLWVPICFHVLMNLAWDLFAMDATALGGVAANVWRFATVGLSVALTLAWTRRHGGREVRGRRWWRG